METAINTAQKKVWYISALKLFGKLVLLFGKEILNLFYLLLFESTKARNTSDIDQDSYLRKNDLFKLVVIREKTSQPESKS